MWKRAVSVVRALTRRTQFEDSMTEEVRFHLEQYAADLRRVAAGAAPAHHRDDGERDAGRPRAVLRGRDGCLRE